MTAFDEKTGFPCSALPDDAGAARLIGLYAQRQEGRWMQRVKILGGSLTEAQWRGLAQIARELTPGAPLHLTTRQDVELHDVTAEAVPAAQAAMAAVGLTGAGACGDTLRNVTICPCSGVVSGSLDLAPLAWQIRHMLEAVDGIDALPRKFKIALSCGPTCNQPWINDLGLIATRRDGRRGFRVIGAGSLGPRPATGVELWDWLDAGDVLPLVAGAVALFAEHGDREHRARARLRHIRQRVGDERFRKMLDGAFQHARGQRDWPAAELPETANGFDDRLTLTFPNGDVSADAAEALAELAGRDDTRVRVGRHHRVIVFARGDVAAADRVAAMPSLAAAARPQVCVVACPGDRWCSHGLTDTNALADRLRAEVTDLAEGTMVCISGCPNGCAHNAVADVGLSGRRAGGQEAYALTAGGGMGKSPALGRPIAEKLSVDDVVAQVRATGGKDSP